MSNPLLSALLEIQQSLKPAKRTQQGESFDWADLPSVLKTCQRKLHERGVLISHYPSGDMHGAIFMATVETRLTHVESGELVTTFAACPCPPDRVEYSACVTLLRRVGLVSLLGIVQAESLTVAHGENFAHNLVNSRRAAAQSPDACSHGIALTESCLRCARLAPNTPTREEYESARRHQAAAEGK